ncbi:hypothetical protein HZS_2514 [Henneguya salminicola]|nr:hypothetical protein HZS_2514 [Henneguya salminicola]
MEASKYNQKKYHDRRTREKNFNENDNVWSYTKLAGEYQPGTIVSKSGPLSYKVAVEKKIEPKHADHLRSREINEGSNISTNEICPFITNDETGVKKSLVEATPDSRSEETEENQNPSPILRRSARIKNFPPIRYYE